MPRKLSLRFFLSIEYPLCFHIKAIVYGLSSFVNLLKMHYKVAYGGENVMKTSNLTSFGQVACSENHRRMEIAKASQGEFLAILAYKPFFSRM
jgi:hypothetical protein